MPPPLMILYLPARPAALSAPGSVSVKAPSTETMYFRLLIRLAADTTAGTRAPPSICGRVKSSSVTGQAGQTLAIWALYAVAIDWKIVYVGTLTSSEAAGAPSEFAICSSAIVVPIVSFSDEYPRPA